MRRGFLTTFLGPALVIAWSVSTWAKDPNNAAYLERQLNKVLEFEPTGTKILWHNPKTGHSGVIVVERTYFADSRTPCREFSYTVEAKFSRPRAFNGKACRSKLGEWLLDDSTDLSAAAPSESLAAFGVADEALEGPPVELRLDEEALRDFAPRARRNDSAKLQRFAGQKDAGGKIRPAIPSGPGPEATEEKVAVLLETQPKPPVACAVVPAETETVETTELDLVVILDTTASMKREFGKVRADILSSIRLLRRMAPSLNVGFVAFRDREDEYLTRAFQLRPMTEDNLERLRDFVERLQAGGGGDVPEALGEALGVAEAMAWRPTALGHIVLIGDAPPPSDDRSAVLAAARRFSDGTDEIRRRITTVFTAKESPSRKRRYGRRFFERLAESGDGCFAEGGNAVIESVLLSVLGEKPS